MIGKKLTIFSNTAFCFERKIEIIDQCKISEKYVFKNKGNWESHILEKFNKNDLVFESWKIPFHTGENFIGDWMQNGKMNLFGTKFLIKPYIEKYNINPRFDETSLFEVAHIKISKLLGNATESMVFY